MKVKVNISTRCISMSESVIIPSMMMMTSIVCEESLPSDTHTHARARARAVASSILNFFKVVSEFEKKKMSRVRRSCDLECQDHRTEKILYSLTIFTANMDMLKQFLK